MGTVVSSIVEVHKFFLQKKAKRYKKTERRAFTLIDK